MTGLRAITRLAIRESRRRPWRSLLVVALIALPAAAAVFVSTWLHTAIDSPREQVESQLGQADVVVHANPGREAQTRDLLTRQPGWRVVEIVEGPGLVSAPRSTRGKLRFRALDIPLADPLVRGLAPQVVGGRPPAVAGEVAVSRSLLRDLGIGVGDTIDTIRPPGTRVVTGVIATPKYLDTVAGPGVAGRVASGSRFLVDTPGPVALPGALRDWRTLSQTRSELLASAENGRTNDRVYLYLYGALGMAAFGLIVAAALAIGARRQLRALGLIGANGATPRQAGLLTLMQAAVLGVVGAMTGVVLGIGASFALRPVVERLTGQAEGPIDLQPVDSIVVGVLAVVVAIGAAWLPARVAARTSVLHALGGRKPLSRLGVRVPLGGLIVSVVGCLMLAWAVAADGTHPDRDTAIAIFGAGLIIAGLVVSSPYLVGLLERFASRTSGTLRLAARTVARQRSRTGPTVAAIMAAGALAVAAATVTLTDDRRSQRAFAADAFAPPRDEVTVDVSAVSLSGGDAVAQTPVAIGCRDVPRQITAALESALGAGSTRCLALTFGTVGTKVPVEVAIVDPESVASVLAAPAVAALRAGNAVALDSAIPDPGPAADLVAVRRGREIRLPVVQGELIGLHLVGHYLNAHLVAPATARQLGVQASQTRTFLQTRAPRALTSSQRDALTALSAQDLGAGLSSRDRDVYVNFYFAQPPSSSDVQLVTYGVILPAAMVLALLTVWIGLALTAAETRDERATLVAVGAGPAHRRRQNAWQAVLVAGLGALLAVPGGLIPAAIVLDSGDGSMATSIAISPPWVILLALVVGLPLLAAGGAALLTRGKMSPLIRRSV